MNQEASLQRSLGYALRDRTSYRISLMQVTSPPAMQVNEIDFDALSDDDDEDEDEDEDGDEDASSGVKDISRLLARYCDLKERCQVLPRLYHLIISRRLCPCLSIFLSLNLQYFFAVHPPKHTSPRSKRL